MNLDLNLLALEKMHGWELYSNDLLIDYRQAMEEGKDVASLESAVKAVAALPVGALREEMADLLFKAFEAAPLRLDYRYLEPSKLRDILVARPVKRFEKRPFDRANYEDKARGAWLGRICGCLLGKPVEGYRTPALKALLEKTDNWPLTRYMTNPDDTSYRCWIDKIDGCAPVDDDTNYTAMAAVRILERYGRDFTAEQVAKTWLDSQTIHAYCTAERVAFKNITAGILPPHSATYKNPYREWIGAQIRADYFGYINPGDPEAAAEMAFRDASISHIKNGIYGEMWAAAMIAAAAVSNDVREVIQAGLSEIPEKSRLHEDITNVLTWHESGVAQEECFARIHLQFDETSAHDWCHTNSNAMIVAAALLYGEKDYGRSICMAVQTGFDTDCNGATVGSVLGMMLGAGAIGDEWSQPICGTLDTSILGIGKVKVDDMVRLTLKHLPG